MVQQKKKPVKRTNTEPAWKNNMKKKSKVPETEDPSVDKALVKHPWKAPKKDDTNAEFNQYFMSKFYRAITIYQCGKCNQQALDWDKEVSYKGKKPCLVLPLCRTCVYTNRRISQIIYFNITAKNVHDRIQEEDKAEHKDGEAEVDCDDDEGEDDEDDEGTDGGDEDEE